MYVWPRLFFFFFHRLQPLSPLSPSHLVLYEFLYSFRRFRFTWPTLSSVVIGESGVVVCVMCLVRVSSLVVRPGFRPGRTTFFSPSSQQVLKWPFLHCLHSLSSSSLSSSSLSRTAKTWWWKTFFSPSSPLVSKWLFSHCLYMVHPLTFFAVEPTSLSTTFSSLSFFTVVSDVRLIWRKIDTHGFDVRLRMRADSATIS